LTTELENEGYVRELTRKIQAARKKLNMVKAEEIELFLNETFIDCWKKIFRR
jgi:hypothetical protein